MPTIEHNGVIDMFRENPPLAPHVLEVLFDVLIPPHTQVTVGEATTDQLAPIEFRADLVIELRDQHGKVVLAIVFEMQRDKDPDKLYSIPVYVAVARSQRRCPTVALVVALNEGVAAWASQSIDLGLGRGHVEPFVLGPKQVPKVVDPAEARKETELSILSAIAHGNGPDGLAVVLAALGALGRVDDDHAAAYFKIVYNALDVAARQVLEKMIMENQAESKPQYPAFAQALIDRGELKGKREGEVKGKIEGELQGKQSALLRLLARAGIPLSEAETMRIRSCTEVATLDAWLDRVLGAKTSADIF